MVTINSMLEDIMQLDYTTREMLLEILQKRQVEARRAEIEKSARQSLKDFKTGKITSLTAEEAIEQLNLL